jgi:hypothetical protein
MIFFSVFKYFCIAFTFFCALHKNLNKSGVPLTLSLLMAPDSTHATSADQNHRGLHCLPFSHYIFGNFPD